MTPEEIQSLREGETITPSELLKDAFNEAKPGDKFEVKQVRHNYIRTRAENGSFWFFSSELWDKLQRCEWQPIATAKTTGPAEWVEVRDKNGKVTRAHYAYGGGDDQPYFGPAWFEEIKGSDGKTLHMAELKLQPIEWRPL